MHRWLFKVFRIPLIKWDRTDGGATRYRLIGAVNSFRMNYNFPLYRRRYNQVFSHRAD